MTKDRAAAMPAAAGIVGAGSIGIAFAVVFARAGWRVKLFDPDPRRRELAPGEIRARLEDLSAYDLLSESWQLVADRVHVVASIEEAATGVELVQECAPEMVELKREIFTQLDATAAADTILASSTSALPVSSFASKLAGRHRCLVTHPGNPPYLLPVIELISAPFTDSASRCRAEKMYRAVGLEPVRVEKEVEGFVFNRLQGALLREAYCLVRDGIASVSDIDTIVRDGLGLRWSVIGPFETVDLNTRGGIASHAQKMGPAYERMGIERGQHDPWLPKLVADVERQRRAALPLDEWDARVKWRDRALMALARHRKRTVEP